ncbi:hypothetical protein [uncultured Pseudokineococcus sp.]|uniref:hypothetical protein n=1 Tax=uncultured Pseudokineococcus sp. TaxID=1642928 RepID=UPI0026343615|nr:hypothetical protein [uncultured Pseudokineococcus sp.]
MTRAPGATSSPGPARAAGSGGASAAPEPAAPALRDQQPDAAEVVRDAVLAVPGVVSLSAGALGEVGTHLPGRRVAGVRLTEDEVEVHVVAELGTPVHLTSARVHRVLAGLAPVSGRRAHVVVDDVLDPAASGRPAPPAA